MPFELTDAHLQSYHTLGYTVFRSILPPTLVTDLRREAEKAREIARRLGGPNAQRLQPVSQHPTELELKPFRDVTNYQPLRDAIAKVLPFEHHWGLADGADCHLGILFEPANEPYCTSWHRDWRDNAAGLPLAEWEPRVPDQRYFNQINCALYEDSCTWVVPGSHARRDLPGEWNRFPTRPIQGPTLSGTGGAERERLCLEYCQSMPGASQVYLNAGDFMLYRNTLWHLGSYVPYKRRATLHDILGTPEFDAWIKRVTPIAAERAGRGQHFEVPRPATERPNLDGADLALKV